jgi:hypothetical protein
MDIPIPRSYLATSGQHVSLKIYSTAEHYLPSWRTSLEREIIGLRCDAFLREALLVVLPLCRRIGWCAGATRKVFELVQVLCALLQDRSSGSKRRLCPSLLCKSRASVWRWQLCRHARVTVHPGTVYTGIVSCWDWLCNKLVSIISAPIKRPRRCHFVFRMHNCRMSRMLVREVDGVVGVAVKRPDWY